VSALAILSEIGADMSRYPSDAHLLSWACMCPRNDESAGRRRSTRMRKGSRWLKATLFSFAWAAARTKGSYFQAQFHRIKARRGAKKAIGELAAALLRTIHHMLKDGTLYQDLGADHFDRRHKTASTRRLVQHLQNVGFAVQLHPLPPHHPPLVSL
jgi:transposase